MRNRWSNRPQSVQRTRHCTSQGRGCCPRCQLRPAPDSRPRPWPARSVRLARELPPPVPGGRRRGWMRQACHRCTSGRDSIRRCTPKWQLPCRCIRWSNRSQSDQRSSRCTSRPPARGRCWRRRRGPGSRPSRPGASSAPSCVWAWGSQRTYTSVPGSIRLCRRMSPRSCRYTRSPNRQPCGRWSWRHTWSDLASSRAIRRRHARHNRPLRLAATRRRWPRQPRERRQGSTNRR